MNDKLQKLVLEIKKYGRAGLPEDEPPPAEAPPATQPPAPPAIPPSGRGTLPPGPAKVKPPTPSTPAPPSTGKPKPTGTSFMGAFKAVRDMQKAIQVFADTAKTYHTSREPRSAHLGRMPATAPAESQQYGYFNDFITLNYLASSPIRGNEWSADPEADTAEEKQPLWDDQVVSMTNVLDNIVRIGRSRSERDPDGNWGWRTNNALKDLYAFGDAIIRLSKDFAAPPVVLRMFTNYDLSIMRRNIPSNDKLSTLSIKDKATKANILAKEIEKLTLFYRWFAQSIVKNPAYRRFTEDSGEPLFTQSSMVKDMGDTSEYSDLMKDLSSVYLSNIYIPKRNGSKLLIGKLPLSTLKDPDALTDLMTSWGEYSANELDSKMKIYFLNYIMQQITSRLQSGTSGTSGGKPPLVMAT
jgi:hypothetical protein